MGANKKGAKPKFRAPTGDTTKERQPLQQSADRLAAMEEYGHQTISGAMTASTAGLIE